QDWAAESKDEPVHVQGCSERIEIDRQPEPELAVRRSGAVPRQRQVGRRRYAVAKNLLERTAGIKRGAASRLEDQPYAGLRKLRRIGGVAPRPRDVVRGDFLAGLNHRRGTVNGVL